MLIEGVTVWRVDQTDSTSCFSIAHTHTHIHTHTHLLLKHRSVRPQRVGDPMSRAVLLPRCRNQSDSLLVCVSVCRVRFILKCERVHRSCAVRSHSDSHSLPLLFSVRSFVTLNPTTRTPTHKGQRTPATATACDESDDSTTAK